MILQRTITSRKKNRDTINTTNCVKITCVFCFYVQAFLQNFFFFKKLSRTAVILLDVGHG